MRHGVKRVVVRGGGGKMRDGGRGVLGDRVTVFTVFVGTAP